MTSRASFPVVRAAALCAALAAAQAARAAPLPIQTAAPRSSVVGQGLVPTGGSANAGYAALVAGSPDAFTGALSQRIPLELPPGAGGLAPTLALSYGSGGASSWTGMGWRLDLGGIERNTRRGLSYGADDYVLDMGSRVELVPVGGNEYRARVESDFKRVRKLAAGDGRAYWEVTDRRGVRYTFGQTAAARQDDPADAGRIFRWCLERVEDAHGNFFTAQYLKHSGEIYPDLLSYGGHGAVPPPHTVRFWRDAGARGDAAPVFRTHFAVTTAYRLQSIEVRTNGIADRLYALAYEPSESTARSRLASIARIGASGTVDPATGVASGPALPTTMFGYTAGTPPAAASFAGPAVAAGPSISGVVNIDLSRVLTGDFDGDGRTDVAYVDGWGSNKPIQIFLANGSGFDPVRYGPSRWVGNTVPAARNDIARVKLGDFNGDGRTDLLTLDGVSGPAPVKVYLAAEGGTFPSAPSFTGPSTLAGVLDVDVSRVFLADFDGDSRTDLLYVPSSAASLPIEVYLSTGTGFRPRIQGPLFAVAAGTTAGISSLSRIKLGDFNGDGRTEIAFVNGSGSSLPMKVYGVNAGATAVQYLMDGPVRWVRADAEGARIDAMRIFPADVNGDGLTDLVALEGWGTSAPVRVYLAGGNGFPTTFTGPSRWFDSVAPDQSIGRLRLGDFNGDGRVDLAFVEGSTGTSLPIGIYLSEGNRFGPKLSGPPRAVSGGTALAQELLRVGVGDFDGDGRADFSGNDSNSNAVPMSIYPAQGGYPDLLAGIRNGIGGALAVSYTPSTAYDNAQLPFPVQAVSATTTDDGNGVSATTTYAYAGGYHHLSEREFRGFHAVVATGPAGPDGERSETRTWFHQGDDVALDANDPSAVVGYTAGKAYRVEVWDLQRSAFSETTTTYWPASGPSHFAPVHEQRTTWCERPPGQVETCGRSTLTTFADFVAGQPAPGYDAYGNPTRENQHGDEADPSDDRTVVRTFSANAAAWIVGLPSQETFYAGAGPTTSLAPDNRLADAWFEYDGALDAATCRSAGSSATPSRGDRTRVLRFLRGGTGPEEWTGYDALGNVVCTSDPDRRVTSYGYDASSTFRTVETNARGHVTRTEYYGVNGVPADLGRYGQPKKVTDPNLAETTYEYDTFGRTTRQARPPVPAPLAGDPYPGYAIATSYFLGAVGTNRVENLTSAGEWTAEVLDGLGRTILTKRKGSASPSARTIATATTYGATGTKRRTSLPYDLSTGTPRWNVFRHDAQGRVTAATKPDGTRALTCFDDRDGSSATIDANDHRRRQVKDVRGNVVRVDEYLGTFPSCTTDVRTPYATTRHAYDRMGRITTTTDAASTQSVADYDTLGRRTFASDPDLGTWYFGYTQAGDLLWQQDANGTDLDPARAYKTHVEYDELHRATLRYRRTAAGARIGSDVSFGYDDPAVPYSKGKRTSMIDAGGTTTYGYDAIGRPWRKVQVIDGVAYVTVTGYDEAGRLARESYPDAAGTAASYGYDADGLLFTVDVGGARRATLTQYNPLAQVGQLALGNAVTARLVYNDDGNNRLRSVTASGPAGTLVALTYEHDPVRNVRSVADAVDPARSQTFDYDELDRLTSASSAALGTLGYGYSPIGNVTLKEGITYTYDPVKVHAVRTTSDGRSYWYDANGNLRGDGARTIEYDHDNRPAAVTLGPSRVVFVYDGDGERVKKQVFSGGALVGTTVYAGRLLECTDGACTRHVFAGERRIASLSADGTARYLHGDHLDSTRAASDQDGRPVESISYRPYGESAPGPTKYRFTGKELDAETGLYYYGARYYDPVLARFVSPDPLAPRLEAPQTLNRYAYALNNPIFYNDPSGYEAMEGGMNVQFEADYTLRLEFGAPGAEPPPDSLVLSGNGQVDSMILHDPYPDFMSRQPQMGPMDPSKYYGKEVTLGVPAGQPVSATFQFGPKELVGLDLGLTVDRWGQTYISVGEKVGLSLTGATWSATLNSVSVPLRNAADSADVHTGFDTGFDFTGFMRESGGTSVSDDGVVTVKYGTGSPGQIGYGMTMTVQTPITIPPWLMPDSFGPPVPGERR